MAVSGILDLPAASQTSQYEDLGTADTKIGPHSRTLANLKFVVLGAKMAQKLPFLWQHIHKAWSERFVKIESIFSADSAISSGAR